ncbi:MAG: porin family protein [Burkholderiaceae bacterium]|nr:porin family protein [Burkholderiaceae bacterium]
MKKSLLALGVSMALAGVTAVQAQPSINPEGFAVGVTAGMLTSTAAYNDGTIDAHGLGKSETTSAINADYTFRGIGIGTLTLGAEYDLSNPELANYRDATNNFTFKQDQRYGVFFSPGFVIANSAMGYLKVGYYWLDVDGRGTRAGQSYGFRGWGYGLGTRYFVDKNVYLSLEWMQTDYGSENIPGGASLKPEGTYGSIGVGYKF